MGLRQILALPGAATSPDMARRQPQWRVPLASAIESLRLPFIKARGALSRLMFESFMGLETTSIVDLRDLQIDPAGRSHYIPSGWATLRHLTRIRPLLPTDVFVDIGSGKGRMAILAATYAVKRVIGVELSRALHETALANLAKSKRMLTCRNVQLVCQDATQFEVPPDVTVVYLFNPFVGAAFLTVLANIQASVARHRRPVTIFYVNPRMHEAMEAQPWLRTVRHEPGNVAIYETCH
jgi:SAM-dependent methyltransferase